MKWRRFTKRTLIIGLALVTVLMAILCYFCVIKTAESVKTQTEQYLNEISHHVAESTNYRVDTVFKTMTGATLLNDETATREEMLNNLRKVVVHYNYLRMSVIEQNDGNDIAYTTDGYTVNLTGSEVVQRAFGGEQIVSPGVLSGIEDETNLNYFVPVNVDGAVGWVLELSIDKETSQDFLSVESFQGKGYSLIIDTDGNFLVSSGQENAESEMTNWFDLLKDQAVFDKGYSLEKIQADITANQPGIVYYETADGIHKAVNYVPLDSNGWYLLSVVPTDVMTQSVQGYIVQMVLVVGSIFALFCSLIAFVLRKENQNRHELETLAFKDSLTGGNNRIYFEMTAFPSLQDNKNKVLVMTNIVGFKWVNDVLGKEAGDRILRQLDKLIEDMLRPGEISGRLGSDNFAIAMDMHSQEILANRLSFITRQTRCIASPQGAAYGVELAWSVYFPEEGMDMLHMIDRAGLALAYGERIAKEEIRVYNDGIRTSILRDKELSDKMHRALEERHFEVFLQPKYELKGEHIAGAEALIRWRDPEEGMIYPDQFIPLFERNGFIVELDLFVFEETCRLLHKWREAGLPMVPIAVNVTKRSLDSGDFPNRYWEVFQKYKVPGRYLEFEFTERIFYGDFQVLSDAIGNIHKLGSACSIDDFGSGYSSLNMLKNIEADVLKLDRAFFDFAEHDRERGYQVVRSVVSMGKSLGMHIVAEGVETREQVELLKELECDQAQGYLFARPMCCGEFEVLLEGDAKDMKPQPCL